MVFQVPQLLHAIGFTLIIDNSIRGNSLKSPTAPNLPNVMVSGTRILSDFGRATIERSQPRFELDSIENLTGIDDKGFQLRLCTITKRRIQDWSENGDRK